MTSKQWLADINALAEMCTRGMLTIEEYLLIANRWTDRSGGNPGNVNDPHDPVQKHSARKGPDNPPV